MPPMIRQQTTELDDYLGMVGLNFDEISSLASGEDYISDNTKLVEDNGLFDLLSQQPSTVFKEPLLVVQPASPRSQPVAEECFINLDTHPASHELLQVLQSGVPEPSWQQALTPAPVLQQAMSPEPCDIQVQPLSPKQLEQQQLFASMKFLTASPADSFVLSPSSVWQQRQEPSSLASQQAADSPNKRGGKSTYREGMASSRRRCTKPKVYEMQPVLDEHLEKKRQNAVNAKKHRDMQKKEKQKLSDDLAKTTAEIDRLQQMVNQYKQREQQLLQMLNARSIKIDGLHPSLEGFCMNTTKLAEA